MSKANRLDRRAVVAELLRDRKGAFAVGGVFTLARFSEAFLVLRAQQSGIALALVPLVMVAMNVVYALAAYPFGKLSDRVSHGRLLAGGLLVLLAADLVLATSSHWSGVLGGVALWVLGIGGAVFWGVVMALLSKTRSARELSILGENAVGKRLHADA